MLRILVTIDILLFCIALISFLSWLGQFLEANPYYDPDRNREHARAQCLVPIIEPIKLVDAHEARCDAKNKRGLDCWSNSWDTRSPDEKEDNAREHSDWYKYIRLNHWFKTEERRLVD